MFAIATKVRGLSAVLFCIPILSGPSLVFAQEPDIPPPNVRVIVEYIYPTEYDVDRYRWKTPEQIQAMIELETSRKYFRPPYCQAYEVRNVGSTLEIHPRIDPDTAVISLHFAPEIVALMQLDTHMEFRDHREDASMRYPRFKTTRSNTITGLRGGQWAFVAVHTPIKANGGPAANRKILLFVRASIIPIGS